MLPTGKFERAVTCVVFVAYVVLAVELARVRPPHADEGNFGNAAAIFASKHYLAMPMLNKVWLPGLNKHLYITTPLYFLGLAAWFKAFGVGLLTERYFSIFWGLVALASWYVIVRVLSGDKLTSLLGLILIGLNYDYANLTSGRYDPMCAGLSAAGLATYLALRERRLELALLLSNLLIACAFMTHPYGLFGFVGLVVFVIGLDRDRIRPKQLAISAAPYIVALAAWGTYIARDVPMFRAQFFGNAKGRLSYLSSPLLGLYSEIHDRYIVILCGWRLDVPVYMRVKLLIVFAILISIIGLVLMQEVRQNRHYRLLLSVTAIWFLMLTFLDATKTYIYLVHIWPAYFALMAIWLRALMKRGTLLRYLSTACVGLLVLFAIVAVAYRARLNNYKNAFLPTMHYLEQRVKGNELVIAPGEFGFGLGFARHVLDDKGLGYKLREKADYIVIDNQYRAQISGLELQHPDARAYVNNMLANEYKIVFRSKSGFESYKVYARVPRHTKQR